MMNWGEEFAPLRQRHGERIGIVDDEGQHRIAEVLDRAAGIADELRRQGLGPGDFVATVFHNSALAAAASYGVALAGITEVPANPALSEAELAHVLACSTARLALVDGADQSLPAMSVRLLDVRAIAPRPLTAQGWPDVAPDAPSRIVFTSGTTGPAKGAIHSHRGRWTGALMLRAALPLLPDGTNRILLMTPFSHGSSLLTFAFLAQGASVHLLRGVDPETVLPLLASGSITEIFAPPTVLAKLTAAAAGPDHAGRRWPLRMILTGTAPLTPLIYRRAVECFGPIIRVTYGKSEIFNPITVLDPAETAEIYAQGQAAGEGLCVGWPASGVRIAIRDDAGRALPPGETGRIHLLSPHLSQGYMTLDGPRMLAPGEYHDTGDLGRIDARGRLFLVSRQSDMMKTGGYKVSPDEVERALAPHLPETELVVLGYPSDYWGEIVTLVAASPPADWLDRLEPALSELTGYKRPRLFVAMGELPRNSIGKIARAQLRRWIGAHYDLVEQPRPQLRPRHAGAEE
ncbi:class I adenylate-forming enzyme family protein [Paracoccus thiocyanatus]|uniref:Long-chain fatty acid--CoA ligase n=1 Tax=Paracoccus thiocyanatus TaxID=34006 RepID=A0A3D8PHF4_9RHOB|nr:class I adenylate-forming enzyme family protein [Paracoccus thiocyanatus]RDW14681.1 long-chain fatty acid--CoA ligase [Paracoccus thiocyanatus]